MKKIVIALCLITCAAVAQDTGYVPLMVNTNGYATKPNPAAGTSVTISNLQTDVFNVTDTNSAEAGIVLIVGADIQDANGDSLINHHYANGYAPNQYDVDLTVQNAWYPATNWTPGLYDADHIVFTNNGVQILAGGAGKYLVNGQATLSLDANRQIIGMTIFTGTNGVTNAMQNAVVSTLFPALNDEGFLAISTIVSLDVDGYMAIYFSNESSAGDTATIYHMNFSMNQIIHQNGN